MCWQFVKQAWDHLTFPAFCLWRPRLEVGTKICDEFCRSHIQLCFFQFFWRVRSEQKHDPLDKGIKERTMNHQSTFQSDKGSFDHRSIRVNDRFTTPRRI